jgi:hypothetical protein
MGLEDDEEGWAVYLERLRQLALDPAEQERLGFGAMSRGWAIGTSGWRRAVAKDHAALALTPGLAAAEAKALREARWQECRDALLAETKKTEADLREATFSAPWKIELAARVRKASAASAAWLAENLVMGKADSVRSYLSRHSLAQHNIDPRFSA